MEKDQPTSYTTQHWTAEVEGFSSTHVRVTLTNRDNTALEDSLYAMVPIEQIPDSISRNLQKASRFILQTTLPPQVGQPIISYAPLPESPAAE